eukprot:13088425-Alexandrium_andersonii.AAC.1
MRQRWIFGHGAVRAEACISKTEGPGTGAQQNARPRQVWPAVHAVQVHDRGMRPGPARGLEHQCARTKLLATCGR